MSVQFRLYHHPEDYQRVSAFLVENYRPGNQDQNWVEPAWEYMHSHPCLDPAYLDRIGIWEDGGKIAAVVNYETRLGEAFFQFHPSYRFLAREMLAYAEANFSGRTESGERFLHAYVSDCDESFLALVKEAGYRLDPGENRPMALFEVPDPFPAIRLPGGYRLMSLADDADWAKVHRVMHRGFDHEGEPPGGDEELESRQKMFDTPSARRDLKIVVAAPDGNFASFCGMFYEPHKRYAYVEPVATDPDHRRMGLGKAAVLEGIRRCAALGATVAYVGSDQQFYLSIGFRVIYTSQCWVKHLPG